MYARIHGAFVARSFFIAGAVLIASTLTFAILTLVFANLGENWHMVLYLIAGGGLLALALYRHENQQAGARFLFYAGALAPIYFLYTFALLLGGLALIVWGIAALVALVE